MKIRILNESISDYIETFIERMDKILSNTFNIKGWINTLGDILNALAYGKNVDTFNWLNYDHTYSNKLTSMFTNTNITVIEYHSKHPNAYTVPGNYLLYRRISSKKFIDVLNAILPSIGILSTISDMAVWYGYIEKAYEMDGRNGKIIYHPSSNKFSFPVKDATLFISTSLKNILDNNEEKIMAVLLHEVGHNLQPVETALSKLINKLVKTFIGSYSLMYLIQWAYMYLTVGLKNSGERDNVIENSYYKNINTEINKATNSSSINEFYYLIAKLVLLSFICSLITTFVTRRQEIEADELAIKLGYGKQLYEAIRTINDFSLFRDFGKSLTKINGVNLVDCSIYFSSIALNWLIQLSGIFKALHYPDPFTRERYIKEKTERYDTSSNNIDRSNKIDNRLFK